MEVWRYDGGEWQHREEEDVQHFFGMVPLAVFPINAERVPLFEAEKSLIDAHDQLISKSQNEIDRFNALIALFPGKVDKAFIQKLSEIKVIDDLGQYDHWPEYLEKSLNNISDFYNQLADRFERLYHKSIKVPDFSDENFGGQSTGIALAYKLLGLEFKAATIESYFKQGIIKLVELINQLFRIGTNGINPDEYKLIIKADRRLPVDKEAAVAVAVQLRGLGVSMETVLKALPGELVEDVAQELERIESESPEVPDVLAE
jgi:SPP1 family phage portal protein